MDIAGFVITTNGNIPIKLIKNIDLTGNYLRNIEEITKLRIFLVDHQETHPGTPIFIRGDSNVNTNNTVRLNIFNDFKSSLKMFSVPIEHKTYHHFLGNGLFDSNIDVIMHALHALLFS